MLCRQCRLCYRQIMKRRRHLALMAGKSETGRATPVRDLSRRPVALFLMLAALLCLPACDRAGAEAESQAGKPRSPRIGSESCKACHAKEHRLWEYGGHSRVSCESCHGPGREHSEALPEERPALKVGDSDSCLSCHGTEATPTLHTNARVPSFEGHMQDLESAHKVRFDREKSMGSCVYCHDPHLLE